MNCHIHYAYIQTDELCRWHIYVLYYVIIYLYSIYIVHRYLQTTDIIWFHHVSSPIHFHLRRHPPPSMHTWRRDSHHPGLPAARRSLRRHQGRLRPSRIWIWTWGEIFPWKMNMAISCKFYLFWRKPQRAINFLYMFGVISLNLAKCRM